MTFLRASLAVRTDAVAASPSTIRSLARAKEYLTANLASPVRLSHVARAARTSPAYLTTLFSRLEGVSLHQYLVQLRLARSLAELPHASDITRLSSDLGFSTHEPLHGVVPPRVWLHAVDVSWLDATRARGHSRAGPHGRKISTAGAAGRWYELIMHAHADEHSLRSMLDAWAAAIQARDADGVSHHRSANLLPFDVVPPLQLRGLDTCAGHEAGERVAFDLRLTVGFEKIDDRWIVVHEHHSETVTPHAGASR